VSATSERSIQEIRRRLLDHYDVHRRDLPWRGESDPYRVWVSEVMLQQTRVQTVIPYYRRWMERFPDVEALAAADEDDVLSLWEGLGYYSRARNLQKAARVVRERHGGSLPDSADALRGLPGFGAYTAGAVASIAFNAPAPAVDGNVRRVLSRLFDLAAPTGAELQARAAELVDPTRPGDFNQALMDLGATVCMPIEPRCSACPLETLCQARVRGTVHLRPGARPRKVIPQRSFAVAVILDREDRVLLVRRPRVGLLGGMWAFPEVEAESATDGGSAPEGTAASNGSIATDGSAAPGGFSVGDASVDRRPGVDRATYMGRALERGRELALACRPLTQLPAVPHTFTHLRALYQPCVVRTDGRSPNDGADRRWVDPTTPGVALPTAQKRILAALVGWLRGGSEPG
jgi:A/G-specific adenine glycosylase